MSTEPVPLSDVACGLPDDATDGLAAAADKSNAERFRPLRERLIYELRCNALDFENPPTGQSKGRPHPMFWVPEFDPGNEENPKGMNSVWMLNAIKKWELELPSMSLVVHSGSQHPLHLIEDKGIREQRTDFLKSRPRFNDDYFDGQRDPVEGWMAATNAWRLPALYVGPNYSMPDFSYGPPPTLFIDAALQAQDDAELIASNDSPVNDEWIMDAVTHQVRCRALLILAPRPPRRVHLVCTHLSTSHPHASCALPSSSRLLAAVRQARRDEGRRRRLLLGPEPAPRDHAG